MPSSHDSRMHSQTGITSAVLEDRFELLKDIGDGSFGSVALARVRTAGAHVARRGTLVAIKTMKKTFESYAPCLDLREVIFLRAVPTHIHLVPALDIFLDPLSKKLHVCMENMDGNLYQLMKSRDQTALDGASVKSILFQILHGLEHIHHHAFFHRDIKPENILVSTSAPHDLTANAATSFATTAPPGLTTSTFRRYSALITPPSTPPTYSVKIADFGLARETHSTHPYTTYVSTRWYRAPEVLLRAGAYSAPVDIWALGAMAVEIANLKPLFPGGNEVDQVWRVCEIMGSPGNWYDKAGHRIGGGDWRDGTRLASRLGFSFPKMAPHSMETILRQPQWPKALAEFVTWCLMWDPRNRPTSAEALRHEYFRDAIDPLRPKSSASRILSSKKNRSIDGRSPRDSAENATVGPMAAATIAAPPVSKPSWFRKSLIRDHPVVLPSQPVAEPVAATPAATANISAVKTETKPVDTRARPAPPIHARTSVVEPEAPSSKFRPFASKRATWTNSSSSNSGLAAPMPILPSIRPISPFSAHINAQAQAQAQAHADAVATTGSATPATSKAPSSGRDGKPAKKIGRQLSIQSQSNHYADFHRQEAERALNGARSPRSPTTEQRESFFSHLRKRARRFSGKPQMPPTPAADDLEANAGCSPFQSHRSSMIIDSNMDSILKKSMGDIESKPSQVVAPTHGPSSYHPHGGSTTTYATGSSASATDLLPQRHPSLSKSISTSALDADAPSHPNGGPISSRTRRALHRSTQHSQIYDTPDEEDELLQEALNSAQSAKRNMERRSRVADDMYHSRHSITKVVSSTPEPKQLASPSTNHSPTGPNPYPTPSPSAKRNGILFDQSIMAEPVTAANSHLSVNKTRAPEPAATVQSRWPTPPYEENEWAAAAAASIFAAGSSNRF